MAAGCMSALTLLNYCAGLTGHVGNLLGCARLQAGRQAAVHIADFFLLSTLHTRAQTGCQAHASALLGVLGCRNPIPEMVRPEAL